MSLCGLAGSLNPIRPCLEGWQVLKSWEHEWQRAYPTPPTLLMFLRPNHSCRQGGRSQYTAMWLMGLMRAWRRHRLGAPGGMQVVV